jgi:hypothetical protein
LGDDADGAEAAVRTAEALAARITGLWDTEEYKLAVAHNASSSLIQALVAPVLIEGGYVTEIHQKVGSSGFRPDFLSDCGRVMVEVERGKTLINNMDMYDMWKCHIHPTANHLILLVPIWYVRNGGRSATYPNVCRRLGQFFEEGNGTNVVSLNVIGY